MFEQLLPFALQRLQKYSYLVGLLPHVPLVPVSVAPSCGVPEIVGGEMFTGFAKLAAAPAPARTPKPITRARADPKAISDPESVHRLLVEPAISMLLCSSKSSEIEIALTLR